MTLQQPHGLSAVGKPVLFFDGNLGDGHVHSFWNKN
jgi:hypothetical protein